jgi:hypothetical protein
LHPIRAPETARFRTCFCGVEIEQSACAAGSLRRQERRGRVARHDHRASARAVSRRVLNWQRRVSVVSGFDVVHISGPRNPECMMDELNGKMIACQILVTGLIARVANDQRDPLRFLTEFRDEIRAVVKGVNIAGIDNTERVRLIAQQTVDELFSLMKPPSSD